VCVNKFQESFQIRNFIKKNVSSGSRSDNVPTDKPDYKTRVNYQLDANICLF